jgi:hypothetical protein
MIPSSVDLHGIINLVDFGIGMSIRPSTEPRTKPGWNESMNNNRMKTAQTRPRGLMLTCDNDNNTDAYQCDKLVEFSKFAAAFVI